MLNLQYTPRATPYAILCKRYTAYAMEDSPFQPPTRRERLRAWMHRHKKALIISASIAVPVLIGGGVTWWLYATQPAEEPPKQVVVEEPEPEPEPVVYYSPLTGAEVPSEAATKQAVTAIMIENSPDARPQSGIKNSGVVFEAIAEGGITRFLVIYQEQKPKLVGPVRSVRMYYVDWLAPFNASVAHVGGSSRALSEIRNGSYRDIDQFFNAGSYWRATDRYAPHNVYTSFEKLDALNKSKGYTSSTFTGFDRKDSDALETPTATKIDVTISSALYNSHYAYDASTNTYKRSQAGAAHLDREDGQIAPRVVIAMKVNETRVFEDGWRESITTTGSGTAYIFQDGGVEEVTWHKKDRASQLYFTDVEGERVALARGQTWISAVPNGSGAVSWN